MIRVKRPARAPAILRDPQKRGKKAARKLCDDYDAGARNFQFDSTIYGAKSVKNVLIRAQHGKCCFCESRITHVSFGDVEHFRPKGGFRQNARDPLQQPGYYWLAYEWTNLLLSCQLCNQRYKQNLFPLKKPEHRVRTHDDAEGVARETAQFIDPAAEDPTLYIGFRGEYILGIDGNGRGSATIQALGLDRTELEEHRRQHVRQTELSRATVRLWTSQQDEGHELTAHEQELLGRHQKALSERQRGDAEYAAMTRALLSVETRV